MATGGGGSSLKQFELEGVQDTGRKVGDGAYATAKELQFRGLKCVGKKIHQLLFESATPAQKAAMLERFEGECELLSRLHHPNIVQFMGVCFERDSRLPILVMEYLPSNLSSCLERYGVLPAEIGYGILRDVALGLRYLHEHSPPIVHRDLSANNVLLTSSMSAKISDLGVAKILDLTPAMMTQKTSTQVPGTPCYMPPEALLARPTYTSKIDSYSFGVLILHVLSGRWPFPADPFRPDPRNPGVLVPVTEVDRRAEYLRMIGEGHPLMRLIRKCLSNAPAQRPESVEIQRQINTIISQMPTTSPNKLEMFRENESLRMQNEGLSAQLQSEHTQIESLQAQVEDLSLHSENLPAPPAPPPSQVEPQLHLLHPQAKLQWKRCADMPVGIRPHTVVIGDRVYVGGGLQDDDASFLISQYNLTRDEWSTLPPHPVCFFGIGQLSGELVTVGGTSYDEITGKVYHLKIESQTWEEFIPPMPTPRCSLSVVSTQSALIACGGTADDFKACATVEVYSNESGQWHTASSLPIPRAFTSSVSIAGSCYLLGGGNDTSKPIKTVMSASIASLVQSATSPPPQQSASNSPPDTVWSTLPDTPLVTSAAATLSGSLLVIGGRGDDKKVSAAVHVFIPLTNSWARFSSGELPQPLSGTTAVTLPSNKLLVVGGLGEISSTVYIASITN